MSVTVYIYSNSSMDGGRYALEDAIEEDFEGAAEISGGGSGSTGWNIDLELQDDATSPAIIDSLVDYLRNKKVPRDTYLVVLPPNTSGSVPGRELRVYPEDNEPISISNISNED